jgi:alkanesulfonate monooxygenase SsuD/methylene tetrahydromethanopterin reductase-like flavin-dependent oxidoreductase (luciferase family)
MTALFGPTDATERAHVLREAGASGVFAFEGPHDVFAPLALAAAVEGLDLMTNVAIAFPRNPIHLAHQANDMERLTKGRFTLGLGTQVRTQIEKRFGAEFDRPFPGWRNSCARCGPSSRRGTPANGSISAGTTTGTR